MIKTMDEAILNCKEGVNNKEGNPNTNEILYSRWENYNSETIEDFYKDFIEPRLPDLDVLEKWNNLLLWYIEQPTAIYFYRGGNVDPTCRRGWMNVLKDPTSNLTIRYIYDDNDFAVYFYKMALDGYCPGQAEFLDFMTTFKEPQNIGWLNKNINSNRRYLSMPGHFMPNKDYEYEKNVLLLQNQTINCCLGTYNYKHSHVFDVKKPYRINGKNYGGNKCELTEKYFKIEKGDEQYYTFNPSIDNYCRVRQVENKHDFDLLKELLKAHTLRFLNPYNHFLAPHQGCNKYTKRDGSFDLDIAEYDGLLNYIIVERRKKYPNFQEFEKKVCWENLCVKNGTGTEKINVIYHEKSLSDTKVYKGYKKANGYANRLNNKKSTRNTQTKPKSAKVNQINNKSAKIQIIFNPSDTSDFIKEFQTKKIAEITITKEDGTTEKKVWKCERMSQDSNLKVNLTSKAWYRKNKHLYKKILCEIK